MIGIYGGTFDPIHIGHINLAIDLLEKRKLAEIWFCPANVNPLKREAAPISAKHRLEMLKLALQGVPNCRIIESELKRPAPSYTIDTLLDLKKAHPNEEFCLILGHDSLKDFLKWHRAEEIAQLLPIFTGRRCKEDICASISNPVICQALEKGLTDTHIMEISSTEIRERLRAGKYCGHLLPAKVMDYIIAHHLYFIPKA